MKKTVDSIFKICMILLLYYLLNQIFLIHFKLMFFEIISFIILAMLVLVGYAFFTKDKRKYIYIISFLGMIISFLFQPIYEIPQGPFLLVRQHFPFHESYFLYSYSLPNEVDSQQFEITKEDQPFYIEGNYVLPIDHEVNIYEIENISYLTFTYQDVHIFGWMYDTDKEQIDLTIEIIKEYIDLYL